jgi:hypothetical protein
MRRITIIRSAAVVLLLLTAGRVDAQQTIWRGRSGGYDVAWTDRDISARRASDGAVVFSARRMADAEWARMARDHDDEVPVRELERKVRLLSVVGSIVSVEEATYCDCGGAHPILWTRFVSYDLARGTVARPHPVAATELVPEADLLRALAADPLIRQAMAKARVRSLPSLAAIPRALQSQEIQPPNDECTYGVGAEFPTEFAVHHLEGGRVALRFSLGHYVEVCRGKMIQAGVLVPLRSGLGPALSAAEARRTGLLMKDLRAIAGGRETIFNYKPRLR